MREIKINPLILTILIILAVFGIISFITLLSNPTLTVTIFGNNSIFNRTNNTNINIGECAIDSDCPQAECVNCLTVCENNICVIKNTGDRRYCTAADRQAECTVDTRGNNLDTPLNPVCGWSDPSKVNCKKYPCAGTYDGGCNACKNSNVLYWTQGACQTK